MMSPPPLLFHAATLPRCSFSPAAADFIFASPLRRLTLIVTLPMMIRYFARGCVDITILIMAGAAAA